MKGGQIRKRVQHSRPLGPRGALKGPGPRPLKEPRGALKMAWAQALKRAQGGTWPCPRERVKLATASGHDTSGHRDIVPRPAGQSWPRVTINVEYRGGML